MFFVSSNILVDVPVWYLFDAVYEVYICLFYLYMYFYLKNVLI